MKSKRGSYIVEAAVVLPVIVFTIITAVLIISFFYQQMEQRCEMHITLRGSAGMITEKTIYGKSGLWQGESRIEKTALGGAVYGKGYVVMKKRGSLRNVSAWEMSGKAHAIDGPKYVRYCQLIRGQLRDEKQ